MQLLGLPYRVGAEVLHQTLPEAGVGGQGRRRPAGGSMGPHQHPQGRLVIGIVVEDAFGHHGRIGGIARRQCRLGGHQPGPGHQAGHRGAVGGRPHRVGLVGQQLAPHQGQRRPGGGPRRARAAGRQPGAGLVDPGLQFGDVEPVGGQRPAAVGPGQPVGAEHRAEAAHEHPDLLDGFGRPVVVGPQDVGHRVGRDGLAPGQGQDLDQRAGLAAAEGAALDPLDLEPAEQPHPQDAQVAHPGPG